MNVPPEHRLANLSVWAIIWTALIGWQVLTLRSARWPSFGVLVKVLRHHWVTRWALLSAWAWLGWHLFARTHT